MPKPLILVFILLILGIFLYFAFPSVFTFANRSIKGIGISAQDKAEMTKVFGEFAVAVRKADSATLRRTSSEKVYLEAMKGRSGTFKTFFNPEYDQDSVTHFEKLTPTDFILYFSDEKKTESGLITIGSSVRMFKIDGKWMVVNYAACSVLGPNCDTHTL